MSSANKQTALAAHRAPRKRPFHGRFRRPEAHVFWAFPAHPEIFTFPACPSFSSSPLCPESFTFPACLEFSASSAHPERSALHQSPRKRPFHQRFRWPGARVFWAFQRGGDFSAFPTHLEFSAHPERSAPHQSSRKRPFHLHSRRPVARVFWAFQRDADFSVSPPCPDFSAFPAHPAPDASGALFRSAVLHGERPGFDQPFAAHAS